MLAQNAPPDGGGDSANPPALPPRPSAAHNIGISSGMQPYATNPYYSPSGYSNPYGNYPAVGSYNMYGGQYGGAYGNAYSSSYGRYGTGAYGAAPQDNPFFRVAEETSRNAFQSVESVVQAFSSVTMMLDSTLNAIYSSFRAVLGVADQFTRLRAQFAQLFTTFALIRLLRRLWRRMLVLLRLRPANYANEANFAWTEAETGVHSIANEILGSGGPRPTSNWPTLVFFAVAIGGPYLIWKLVSKMVSTVEDSRRWARAEMEHYEARALFDFRAADDQELSFRHGDLLRIAPKHAQPAVRGWLLASNADGSAIGIVPMNYIKLLGKKTGVSADKNFEEAFNNA